MTKRFWLGLAGVVGASLCLAGAVRAAAPAPVAYDDLPVAAKLTLQSYYRDLVAHGDCTVPSFERFVLMLGPLLQTDYNGDGQSDYVFNANCEGGATDAVGRLMVSDPMGYHIAQRFTSTFTQINGHYALISPVDCRDGDCYFVREWQGDHWGDVRRIGGAPAAPAPAPRVVPRAPVVVAVAPPPPPPVPAPVTPPPAAPAPVVPPPVAVAVLPPPPPPPPPAVAPVIKPAPAEAPIQPVTPVATPAPVEALAEPATQPQLPAPDADIPPPPAEAQAKLSALFAAAESQHTAQDTPDHGDLPAKAAAAPRAARASRTKTHKAPAAKAKDAPVKDAEPAAPPAPAEKPAPPEPEPAAEPAPSTAPVTAEDKPAEDKPAAPAPAAKTDPAGTWLSTQALPAPVKTALLKYYKASADKDDSGHTVYCNTKTQAQFFDELNTVFVTDFNKDGKPDYIFTDLCAPPCNGFGCSFVSDVILLSGPKGLHFGTTFSSRALRFGDETLLGSGGYCNGTPTPGFEDNVCLGLQTYDAKRHAWNAPRWATLSDDGKSYQWKTPNALAIRKLENKDFAFESGASCSVADKKGNLIFLDDLGHAAIHLNTGVVVFQDNNKVQGKVDGYLSDDSNVFVQIIPYGKSKSTGEESDEQPAHIIVHDHSGARLVVDGIQSCGS